MNHLNIIMKKKSRKNLLTRLPLGSTDAARLVLEAVEEMPELQQAAQQGRLPLMQALRRVLREGIAAVQAQEKTVSFAHAAQESLERRTRAGRRPTTLRDLRHFIHRLLSVSGLAERPLRAIGTAECRAALDVAFAGSAHSYRKGRVILHSIFAYGMRQQWCSSNPVTGIELPRVEEKEIVPLTLTECRRLVEVAQSPRFRDCLPALGLMLFAGVRPAEVARLRWADVHGEEGMLAISARHSTTGGARRVELCPPLRRMLRRQRPAKADEGHAPLCPPRWPERWRLLRQAAGLATPARPWVPDVLRHTFASYHALTHQGLNALRMPLGHPEYRLQLTRYLNLQPLRRAEKENFWQLLG